MTMSITSSIYFQIK